MSEKPSARSGVKSTEAQVFGSDAERIALQGDAPLASANALDAKLLNPDPQPAPSSPGDLAIVTGFAEAGMDVVLEDDNFVITLSDPERRRAIVEALHCHIGVLRGLIARREGEFSTNPSSTEYEISALKKGKLRAETLLAEIEPAA